MKRSSLLAAVASLAVASTVLLAGCANPAKNMNASPAMRDTGLLTLSVNPEVQLEYDKAGNVIGLVGQNEDGKSIVSGYPNYDGKECDDALQELIGNIYAAGYFDDDIDGNERNIVLQIEPGSVMPNDHFMDDMRAAAQYAAESLDLSSRVVIIDDDDYDRAYANNDGRSPYITLDKAKEIALAQAKVNPADAVFVEKDFDHDDGTPIFELEFVVDGQEYEYYVHAVTGKVVKARHGDVGTLGATDYDDTDYGPNNDGATDYGNTDYGLNADGVTDYDDTDYGPNNDGVTDYDDTDYGPYNDGVTDYNDTDYGPYGDGVTDYSSSYSSGSTNYSSGNSNYSSGNSNYGSSNYGDSDYS